MKQVDERGNDYIKARVKLLEKKQWAWGTMATNKTYFL